MSLHISRNALRLAAGSVATVLILFTIVAVLALRDAVAAGHEVESAQQELRGFLHGGDLLHVTRPRVSGAAQKLDEAASRLHRDRLLLSPLFPLMHAAGFLPLVGAPISEAPDLLGLGQTVASGGADLAHGVDPLLAETEGAAPGTAPDAAAAPGARLANALDAGAADFLRGDVSLHRAVTLRARLHPERYRGPLDSVRRQIVLLDNDLALIVRQADALALLPAAARTLFGFSGPRTYVILGQDSAELRPTGGFIGSAGLITFDRGRLSFQEYRSSYDFDPLTVPPLAPPLPLQQYLGAAAWYLRDANWSPDFPTTARQVLDFVNRATGLQADGVIGFDSQAVTDLLTATGPVQVEGFSEPITAANWFDLTTRTIFTGENSLENQVQNYNLAKGAGLGAVLRAVLSQVQSVHGKGLLAIVDGLRKAALGVHLQLGLTDQQPSTWARLVGADGALFPATDGDIVAPVEANVSYSKIGPYIERRLDYDVWLNRDGRPERSQIRLTYRNTVVDALLADPANRIEGTRWNLATGGFQRSPGLYADYLRLFLPGGSALQSAAGFDSPVLATAEQDYSVLGGLLALPPHAERTVSCSYRETVWSLPGGQYRLTLVKQSGIDLLPVNLTIHLAPGSSVEALPAGAHSNGDTISLAIEMASTTRIDLRLTARPLPPVSPAGPSFLSPTAAP